LENLTTIKKRYLFSYQCESEARMWLIIGSRSELGNV